MNTLSILLGFLLLFFGFSIILVGWKIHRQMIGLAGFITGALIGNFIYVEILRQDFFVFQLVLVPLVGVAFLIIFLVYERWALSITGGVVGALVISGFTSTRVLIDWDAETPIFAPHYNYVALFAAFLVFFYLSHKFFKLGYIFLSTFIGSIFIAYGGVGIGFWSYDNLGLFLLLSILTGIIIQLHSEGEVKERLLRINDYKYCISCGNQLKPGTLKCPRCGKNNNY